MVFHIHDFTDSEDESVGGPPSPRPPPEGASPPSGGHFLDDDIDVDMNDEASSEIDVGEEQSESRAPIAAPRVAAVPPSPTASSSGQRLRVTLTRPNLPPSTPPLPHAPIHASASSQRSSLSPPPPIKLKLSRHPAEKPAYITPAEDDIQAYTAKPASASSSSKPASSGPKLGRKSPKKKSSSSLTSLHSSSSPALTSTTPLYIGGGPPGGAGAGMGKVQASHRKTYDWLQPSAAAASHHGPPDRSGAKLILKTKGKGAEKDDVPLLTEEKPVVEEQADTESVRADQGSGTGNVEMDPVDELMALAAPSGPPEGRKKSHKKRPADAPPGPGKNWRKGLKKGMLSNPRLEGLGEGASTTGSPPPDGQMMSREGSPEDMPLNPPISVPGPRGPDVPFVLANSETLGIPIYPRPISNPKITLGTFPRVTQFFAPINGGDSGPFPRKERVRSWKSVERSLVGIGGGVLKYKSWNRGPPSELGRLIQADRQVKDMQRAENARAAVAAKKSAAASAAGTPGQLLTELNLPIPWDRPPLNSTTSYDSNLNVPTDTKSVMDDAADDASEMGDENESVAGSAAGSSANVLAVPVAPPQASKGTKRKASGKPKAKPRKSKLAQEIVPAEEGSEEISIQAEA